MTALLTDARVLSKKLSLLKAWSAPLRDSDHAEAHAAVLGVEHFTGPLAELVQQTAEAIDVDLHPETCQLLACALLLALERDEIERMRWGLVEHFQAFLKKRAGWFGYMLAKKAGQGMLDRSLPEGLTAR